MALSDTIRRALRLRDAVDDGWQTDGWLCVCLDYRIGHGRDARYPRLKHLSRRECALFTEGEAAGYLDAVNEGHSNPALGG